VSSIRNSENARPVPRPRPTLLTRIVPFVCTPIQGDSASAKIGGKEEAIERVEHSTPNRSIGTYEIADQIARKG
jgi:hypothetical protein